VIGTVQAGGCNWCSTHGSPLVYTCPQASAVDWYPSGGEKYTFPAGNQACDVGDCTSWNGGSYNPSCGDPSDCRQSIGDALTSDCVPWYSPPALCDCTYGGYTYYTWQC